MSDTQGVTRRQVRSPRSAAVAGIVYSVLIIAGMALTSRVVGSMPDDVTREWLLAWSGTASAALVLVPFAGIAFLWFTGVIRDRMGDSEDRFFATLFFGSGLISVVLMFVWAAVFGATMGTSALAAIGTADDLIYTFGFAVMNQIMGNYALRMAGVYMTAIATLWTKTDTAPRWLTISTYILAIGFLLFAERIREARYIFPVWVFVVSVYVLVINYRRTHGGSESRGDGAE